MSGLKETFIKRYKVERTNKAEIRPEEQSEKTESCREKLWNEIQLKGLQDRNKHKNRIKRSEQARLVYVKNKSQHPPPLPAREVEPVGTFVYGTLHLKS